MPHTSIDISIYVRYYIKILNNKGFYQIHSLLYRDAFKSFEIPFSRDKIAAQEEI